MLVEDIIIGETEAQSVNSVSVKYCACADSSVNVDLLYDNNSSGNGNFDDDDNNLICNGNIENDIDHSIRSSMNVTKNNVCADGQNKTCYKYKFDDIGKRNLNDSELFYGIHNVVQMPKVTEVKCELKRQIKEELEKQMKEELEKQMKEELEKQIKEELERQFKQDQEQRMKQILLTYQIVAIFTAVIVIISFCSMAVLAMNYVTFLQDNIREKDQMVKEMVLKLQQTTAMADRPGLLGVVNNLLSSFGFW